MCLIFGLFSLSPQDDLTRLKCLEECVGDGGNSGGLTNSGPDYRFFGLQNGNECWCPNSVGAYNFKRLGSSTSCDIDCTGDDTENCGGRSAMRVFGEKCKFVVLYDVIHV